MIKVRPIHMDYNRSPDLNNPYNLEKDKSWLVQLNYFLCPDKDYKYKELELTLDNPDYYLVFGSLYNYKKDYYFPESKAVLFHVEPLALRIKFKGNGYNPLNFGSNFLKTFNILPLWWGCNLTYNQSLDDNIEKTKLMSAVISSTRGTEGHIRRLNFLRDYLSTMDGLDHYGHEISGSDLFVKGSKYIKYKGYSPDKSKCLLPYKYFFCAENSYEKDYITEKLLEGIVGECLTFYQGCPNFNDYINPDCFMQLDLSDPAKCWNIVQEAIKNDEWSKRINIIKQEKRKIVENLNPLQLTLNAINNTKNYFEK